MVNSPQHIPGLQMLSPCYSQQGIVIVRSQTSADLERYCKMERVCSIIRNFTKLNLLKL